MTLQLQETLRVFADSWSYQGGHAFDQWIKEMSCYVIWGYWLFLMTKCRQNIDNIKLASSYTGNNNYLTLSFLCCSIGLTWCDLCIILWGTYLYSFTLCSITCMHNLTILHRILCSMWHPSRQKRMQFQVPYLECLTDNLWENTNTDRNDDYRSHHKTTHTHTHACFTCTEKKPLSSIFDDGC